MPEETIQLGDKSYHLRAQRIGFLRKRLNDFLSTVDADSLNTEANDAIGMLGGQAWKALRIFIPDLMPEHEFQGYPTAEAMQPIPDAAWQPGEGQTEDDRPMIVPDPDPDTDRSPTVPEVRKAFAACIEVNGFDIFKHLRGLVDGDFLRAAATKLLADFVANRSPSPTQS